MSRMKKAAALFLALLFAMALAVPVFGAAEPNYYVFDEAGLFTSDGYAQVYAKAQDVSETLGVDVVILTTDYDHGYTAAQFIEIFYDEAEYGSGAGRDGIMLYIDLYNREIMCLTNGRADDWLWKHNEAIWSSGTKLATAGKYAESVTTMLETAKKHALRENGYAGLGFGGRLAYKLTPQYVGISLGIGAVAAALVVGILLAMHYTGSPKAPHAALYFGEGGLRTTHAADYFVHTHTTRTAIPKDNGSSGGSSGGGGGGGGRTVGGGKF